MWLFVGPCFSTLLYNPKSIGIARHIEMQDLTPVVADNEKAVQNTKRERWDGEKVHRSNGLAMVSEERQPSLHRVWISRGVPDPARDTPLREIETQLEQFAVNARRSLGWILSNHTEDQGANLFADTLPSSYLAGPAHSQRSPEQFVQGSQSTARSLRVQSQQLPTESQVFEDEVHPATERTDHPRKCRSDMIMARILAEKTESALRPVIHFAGVRPFGEAQDDIDVERGILQVRQSTWRGKLGDGNIAQWVLGAKRKSQDSPNGFQNNLGMNFR